jgi:hypothetical protein
MFVGHYGPAFAAKAAKDTIPLWVAFIAVQLVDIVWAILILLGVEKARIVPGFTPTNPFDLYYMPYTHSLVGALLWSSAGALVYRLWRKRESWSTAAVVGAMVFSHWVLDLLMHRPDLPLYGESFKLGLGLWNYRAFAFLLELAMLFGGICLYLNTTAPVSRTGRYAMVAFGIAMMAVQAVTFFGPPPASADELAITALVFYFAFAGVAYWLEKQRVPAFARQSYRAA